MNALKYPLVGLALLVASLIAAGCATMTSSPDLEAASLNDVQAQAWGEVKDLRASLARLDADRHPGVAALVEDLTAAIAQVEDLAGPHYDTIDTAKLVRENPHYWQAMVELAPTDPTLLVLDGMLTAAKGQVEGASDILEMVRAGTLPEEELDTKIVLQRRTISKWRWNPPGVDLAMVAGFPPAERWQPAKQAQQMHPDSPTAALAVLQMRADLAGIELVGAGDDQRMKDKILAAEPDAVATLQRHQPLRAAIITATGDAADAADRVAEILEPDPTGILNLNEEDFAKLVADLSRMDVPQWTLLASRLQMAQRGVATAADIEVWRQVLPELIDAEDATEILTRWENGDVPGSQIYTASDATDYPADKPIDPVVGGVYERMYRNASAVLEHTLPLDAERESALAQLGLSARMLGRYEEAERALNELAAISDNKRLLASERLDLAMVRRDRVGTQQAAAALRKLDRRLINTNFAIGNAEILAGNWSAAAEAFARGFENENADLTRRGFAALHAYGAAQLAGEDLTAMVRDALTVVPPDGWIKSLLLAVIGEMDREQLLAAADDGRTHLVVGQRCEAFFALAFAPGQTPEGRRADLIACYETGKIGYIEYEFARNWLGL
jgi:tetratricopeptide (TPR) repeat protein